MKTKNIAKVLLDEKVLVGLQNPRLQRLQSTHHQANKCYAVEEEGGRTNTTSKNTTTLRMLLSGKGGKMPNFPFFHDEASRGSPIL